MMFLLVINICKHSPSYVTPFQGSYLSFERFLGRCPGLVCVAPLGLKTVFDTEKANGDVVFLLKTIRSLIRSARLHPFVAACTLFLQNTASYDGGRRVKVGRP